MFSLRSLQGYRVARVIRSSADWQKLTLVHTHKLSPAQGDAWELHTGCGLNQAVRGSDYIYSSTEHCGFIVEDLVVGGFSSEHLSPVILLESSLGSNWIAILLRYKWILAMNYKITWPDDLWGFGESPTKWPCTWTVTIQRIDKFDVCFPGQEQKSTGL